MTLFPGLPGWAGTRKGKPIWILLKQERVSGSGIRWAMCKSASRSRQITMPVSHHSSFLQAGCPSCRPTNSVKALKAKSTITIITKCLPRNYTPQQLIKKQIVKLVCAWVATWNFTGQRRRLCRSAAGYSGRGPRPRLRVCSWLLRQSVSRRESFSKVVSIATDRRFVAMIIYNRVCLLYLQYKLLLPRLII